jgi:hypothetical protein
MRTLVLLLCLFSLPAAAANCPEPSRAPQLVMSVKQSPVRHDNTQNMHDLIDLASNLSAASVAAAAGHRHVPLGLTEVKTRLNSKIESEVWQLPDGTFCAALRTLYVDMVFDNTTVYVATNLPRSSCIYREVLTHEYKHVEVDRQLLASWRAPLTQEVENLMRGIGMIRAHSQEEISRILKAKLEPGLNRSFQQLVDARDAAQAQIDTRQEYERVSTSCNGEVRKYVPAGLMQ